MNLFLLALGIGALGFGYAADSAAALIFGFLNLLLAIAALEIGPYRRNRSASHDLSSLNREDERIAWEHERIRRVG